MITRDDITFTDRHLGLDENTQSFCLTAILILEQHTTIERLQGKPPTLSDYEPLATAILKLIYGSILKDLSLGIQLLHNDPTQARQVLNELHTKIQNEINP